MEVKLTEGFLEDCDEFGLFLDDKWAKTPWQKLKRLYWKTIPYDWRPGQIWYRLTCFLWKRYTTVKPRTLPYHTWCDRDVLMVHCMFEILCRFIEGEKPAEWFDLETPEKYEQAIKQWGKTE